MNTKKYKILAVVPARGGSRGVPRKNIQLLLGKPLIMYVIEAAIASGVINRLVVSTEDAEIEQIVKKNGVEVVARPPELASDAALTEPVMAHALRALKKNGYFPDFISLIQCTSPFLTGQVIKDAVSKVTTGGFDSCITVFYPRSHCFKWRRGQHGQFLPEHDPDNRPRRQDMEPIYYENGAFYITRMELFEKTKNRFGGKLAKTTAIEMSEEDSLQIDTKYDLWLAEQILQKRISQNRMAHGNKSTGL